MNSRYDPKHRALQEKVLRDSVARAEIPDVRPDQAVDFIVEHLATSEYRSGIDDVASVQADRIYEDNSRLWRELLDGTIRANTVVKLRNFTLTEWVPRSPGIFHTVNAMRARDEAWRYRLSEDDLRFGVGRFSPMSQAELFRRRRYAEKNARKINRSSSNNPVVFAPKGKLSMIQGGIGCVRLQPLELRREMFWLWGATSSKIVHEGIPVAIRDEQYNKLANEVINGGLTCDIIGRLRYIRSSGYLEYGQNVPRCYLEVETISLYDSGAKRFPLFNLGTSQKKPSCLVCVAVSFEHADSSLCATYASFESDKRESFEQAIEWMDKEYVGRLYGGRIVTDFDETASPFSDVLFCLKDVMNGTIAKGASRLVFSVDQGYYAERIARAVEAARSITIERVSAMTTKIIKIGPNATVSAPITIADSIENSFNAIKDASERGELKVLLEDFLKAIASISSLIPEKESKGLARDASDMVREATSEEPRSDVCRTLLDRISRTAVALGAVAVPLSNCVTALLKFFSETSG